MPPPKRLEGRYVFSGLLLHLTSLGSSWNLGSCTVLKEAFSSQCVESPTSVPGCCPCVSCRGCPCWSWAFALLLMLVLQQPAFSESAPKESPGTEAAPLGPSQQFSKGTQPQSWWGNPWNGSPLATFDAPTPCFGFSPPPPTQMTLLHPPLTRDYDHLLEESGAVVLNQGGGCGSDFSPQETVDLSLSHSWGSAQLGTYWM